jgi:glycosyltransferase involved in cell wall biosynthesis
VLKHLQVTPSFFSETKIGGCECHVQNLHKALRATAAARDFSIKCDILAFGTQPGSLVTRDELRARLIQGDPGELNSLEADVMKAELASGDVVHVHQPLSVFGLFVAAHAKLLGKPVIGTDHGGGVADHILGPHPNFASIYDIFVAQSKFAALGFSEFGVRCAIIFGPVDDEFFVLGESSHRERNLILSVGQFLPHEGFETIIDSLAHGLTLVIAGRPQDLDYRNFLQSRALGKSVYFEETWDDIELRRLMHRAGLYVHAGTHWDYRGNFHPKPELLGLRPLEFLCGGGLAFVSRAGALRELGELTGCTTFVGAHELKNLLEQYVSGQMEPHAPTDIRDGVVAKYGLRQFGDRYLQLLRAVNADPPDQ